MIEAGGDDEDLFAERAFVQRKALGSDFLGEIHSTAS